MDPQKVIHCDPEILGGKPVFVGTRVPVKSLYDYLEGGDSLDEFLDNFPSVPMRLLLDECVPRPLKRELAGHQVSTVVEMEWSSKRNGELLDLLQVERFDAILTVDQNLSSRLSSQRWAP